MFFTQIHIIIVLTFSLITSTYCQPYSISCTLHKTTQNKQHTLGLTNETKKRLNSLHLELTLYRDIKNITAFIAYQINYNTAEYSFSENDHVKQYNLSQPNYLNKVKIGIGSRYNLNTKLNTVVFFNIGFGWLKKYGKIIKTYNTKTYGLESETYQEYSGEKHYLSGLKTALEYALNKRILLGIEINFHLSLVHTKDFTKTINQLYNEDGNIISSSNTIIKYNWSDFQTSFLDPGLYIRIVI